MTNNQAQIIQEILKERQRQDEKFGANRDQLEIEWLSILSEEVGEVAQCCVELHWSEFAKDGMNEQKLYRELIQVAAVSVAWLERMRAAQTKTSLNPASESAPIDMGYTIGYRETRSESEGGFW